MRKGSLTNFYCHVLQKSVTNNGQLWFVIQLVQIPTLALIKVAALCFYRRLFVTSRGRLLNKIIWAIIILTTAWAISFIAFYVAACGSHVKAAWGGYLPFSQYCLTTERFEEAYAISDFMLDTFVLIVPIPSVCSTAVFVFRLRVTS